MFFSFVMVVNAIYREPRVTGLGLLLIAAGIPLYFWFTRRAKSGLRVELRPWLAPGLLQSRDDPGPVV